jgi:hypothetical protein
MPRQKMQPEYFLNRIREFQKKNGRPPRSDEFNAPFHGNIMKYFGSWQKGVKAALGVTLDHGHRTDEELFKEIRDFTAANGRIPNSSELRHAKLLIRRCGLYALAIEAATGHNPQTEILLVLRRLTASVQYASVYEIAQEMPEFMEFKITRAQIRGFLGHMVHDELLEIRRGDRLALYKLSSKGLQTLKEREHKIVEKATHAV